MFPTHVAFGVAKLPLPLPRPLLLRLNGVVHGRRGLVVLSLRYLQRDSRVAPLTNDSNLERCQRYANLLPEM